MKLETSEAPRRAGELALLASALLIPLAFYLRTYDSTAIKAAAAQWCALALAFAWLWQGLARGRYAVSAASWPALAPALLYIAWSLARFLAADYKAGALPYAVDQWTLWTVFVAAFLGLAGARAASRLAAMTLAAGAVAALYAVAQAAGSDPFIWKGAFGPGPLGARAFSTFGNPHFLAVFLALVPPLALTYAGDPETPSPLRRAALCLLPLAGFAAVLTGSPEGLAQFAAIQFAFAVLFPLAAGARAAWRSGAAALALGAAVAAAAWGLGVFANAPSVPARPASRRTWSETARVRELTRDAARRLAAERPLLGHGTGSFALHYPRVRPAEVIRLEGRHNTMTDHAESSWLTARVERGWPGALLWAWLWAAALWTGLAGAAALRRAGAAAEANYAAGFSATAAGTFACSFFFMSWERVELAWLPWTLAGLGAGLAALAARRAPVSAWPLPVSPGVRRALRAPGLLALAALAVPPGLWLKSEVDHNWAIFHAKNGDLDRAVALWETIPAGARHYATSLYFRGNARLDQGRAEEALAYYDRLRAGAAPDFVQVHYMRGVALAKLGRWEESALAHARQAELDPLFVPNLARWAEAARAAGDMDSARRAVALARAEAPGDEAVRLQDAANDAHERRLVAERQRAASRGSRSTVKAGRPSAP